MTTKPAHKVLMAVVVPRLLCSSGQPRSGASPAISISRKQRINLKLQLSGSPLNSDYKVAEFGLLQHAHGGIVRGTLVMVPIGVWLMG
jgi:hypothetical protein